jgi:hypothetical protein
MRMLAAAISPATTQVIDATTKQTARVRSRRQDAANLAHAEYCYLQKSGKQSYVRQTNECAE